MNQRIFVTGGTGFVGSYLLRYLLDRGYRNIVALRRADSSMDLVEGIKAEVDWVTGDLLDYYSLEDAMKSAEEVYHCAAIISFDPGEVDQMMQVNREGT
ncbi:MAG: NAD-dependent epimerase/dehydratase family protein, partial [Saprospiraceae bacterium]|nr:NAD-dependent epimerase/dehydratase family protein [Saprospiraceae bacterium]